MGALRSVSDILAEIATPEDKRLLIKDLAETVEMMGDQNELFRNCIDDIVDAIGRMTDAQRRLTTDKYPKRYQPSPQLELGIDIQTRIEDDQDTS